jgi:RNA polymerase sigma factor (sigma-70 family)
LDKAVRSDEEIFDKIKAGQDVLREIVDEIARKYADDLLKFCGRILVTYERQRLEDVVQEVFVAVYLYIQRYDINRGTEGIKHWLRGIARKKCLDELRRNKSGEISTSEFSELEATNPGTQENDEHLI